MNLQAVIKDAANLQEKPKKEKPKKEEKEEKPEDKHVVKSLEFSYFKYFFENLVTNLLFIIIRYL